MKISSPTPAIKISIQRMVCTGCGAEANTSCNCGKAYVPMAVRAAEAIKANPEKSDRAIAADIGVAPNTVKTARDELRSTAQLEDGERIGLDGKTRKLPKKPDDAELERDRKECVALNQKAIEAERERAEYLEMTPEGLVVLAEQAADLAEMFSASIKASPSAISDEAIRGVYRVVDRWSALLKATAAARTATPDDNLEIPGFLRRDAEAQP
jgi:hypothetical protein